MATLEDKPVIRCESCGNTVPMQIVGEYSDVSAQYDEKFEAYLKSGFYHLLLLCPTCKKLSYGRRFWHEFSSGVEEVEYEILYPGSGKAPLGLPEEIKKAYDAATKVRNIDANAYAVLIGRTLEMVCADRKAKGKTLAAKLSDLAEKGEIPGALDDIAKNLRNLRNIGAHAELGELTIAEIPILNDLCKAILEYVYTAPHLVSLAEKRLKDLQGKKET